MLKLTNKNRENEIAVTVTTDTFLRLAGLTIGLILLLLAVKKASHALILVFTSFFLALALNGPVFWLSKKLPGKGKGSRSIATTLSFLLVIILLGGFLASILPPLIRQTGTLINAAPSIVKDYRNQSGAIGNFIRHYHLQSQVNALSSQLSTRLDHVSGSAFDFVRHLGSSIFALLTILVLTFMMLVEGPRWVNFFREVVPDKHHSMFDRISVDMYKVIKGFVNGQVILAAIASALIMPAVLILHISYPAALIVVIFICALIPLVGHTIGAVIVTLVALFDSTSAAIIILAYYIFYMQVENYIFQPRIQANTTNMSPLLVFMSLVIGLSFGGLLGGLVAIPVGGCIRIAILEYLYSNKIIDTPQVKKDLSKDTKLFRS
jgi:predicted PurR-regulated permease PerM